MIKDRLMLNLHVTPDILGWLALLQGDYFVAMTAAFVAIIESSGAFIAAARYSGATPIPQQTFIRGTICQGVSTIVSSVFGVTGMTVSVDNVGLLGLTTVASRRVIRLSALIMIIISVIGKVGAFLASIPLSVVAAWSLLLHGYVAGVGLSFLQFCNLNSYRPLWIVGFAFSLGLSVPAYFASHGSSAVFIHVVCSSTAAMSVLGGIMAELMYTCRGKKYHKLDSGYHWFRRFKEYNDAARTKDYYSAPFNLPGVLPQV